jgi:small-conductance mechanosensitive channel
MCSMIRRRASLFDAFGDSALMFRVLAWIADIEQSFSMPHRLNVQIDAALRDAGVEIPFPQRDLHLRSLPAGFAPSTVGDPPASRTGSNGDGGQAAASSQSGS